MNSHFSHIALLVSNVEESAKFLKSKNIKSESPQTFESEGTKEIYVGSYENQSGLLLLVEAISDGPYKKAMTKRGPSLHHIAIDVLDIEIFITKALESGWQLHPVSEETMSYKTAWLFLKGLPTLIEVQQKKILSAMPAKISKVELLLKKEQLSFFISIGLGDVVSCGEQLSFSVDGQKLVFNDIACFK